MPETEPLRVLIADDEPLAAERLQLLLATRRRRAAGRHRERWRQRDQPDRGASSRPAAARHRHAGPRRDRRRPGACRAEPLPGRRVRDRLRPVRGRRLRGRSGRLSDEAGRSHPAAARARPRPRLSRSSASAQPRAGQGVAMARGILGVGPVGPGADRRRATSTGCRPSAITCAFTSAGAAG